MEKLKEKFRDTRMDYEVLSRGYSPELEKDVVLCEVTAKDTSKHYDVCAVLIHKQTEIFGNTIDARERIPKSSDWGKYAWSYGTYEKAQAKFTSLIK